MLNGVANEHTRIEQVKSSVANAIDSLKQKHLPEKAKASIVEHPIAAIGIAIGVGYLAMRLVRWARA